MNGFSECVLAIYERMGVDLEPSKVGELLEILEELNAACADWHRERGPKMGFLKFMLPDLFNSPVIITGRLDAAETVGFCGNAAARDFVRYVDSRTNSKCTLVMLQVVIYLQHAIHESASPGSAVNAGGGSA